MLPMGFPEVPTCGASVGAGRNARPEDPGSRRLQRAHGGQSFNVLPAKVHLSFRSQHGLGFASSALLPTFSLKQTAEKKGTLIVTSLLEDLVDHSMMFAVTQLPISATATLDLLTSTDKSRQPSISPRGVLYWWSSVLFEFAHCEA